MKITCEQLLNMAWQQAEMVTDPYQKAKLYLEMAEIIQDNNSDNEKEKSTTKEDLKPQAAKAEEPIKETKAEKVTEEKEEPVKSETPMATTQSTSVNEIEDTWTDAMYEMFKKEYDSVVHDIVQWKLNTATVTNIVKIATDNTWQPKVDLKNVDMSTREGLEEVGILPKNIRLIYAFIQQKKADAKKSA